MVYLITTIHVIVCLFLVVVVLLQSGKAADLASAFGGMGSQTVFGPRGSATMLSKATTVAAAVFMITSLTLSIMATRVGGTAVPSIFEKKPAKTTTQGAPPAAGQTVPIQVTPQVNGQQSSPTQTIPTQVQQTPTLPTQKK